MSTKGALFLEIPEKRESSFDLEGHVQSIEYLILDFDSEKFVKRKDSQIYFVDGKIIIYDRKEIFIFNDKGKLLNKISKDGDSKEGYNSITNLWLSNNTIQIFDLSTRDVIIYDINDGRFIKRIPYFNKGFSSDVISINNDTYLSSYFLSDRSHSAVGLCEVDKNGTFVKNLYEYDVDHIYNFPSIASGFSILDNAIYLTDPYSNSLFVYKNGNLSTYMSYSKALDSKTNKEYCLMNHVKKSIVFAEWYSLKTRKLSYTLFDKQARTLNLFDSIHSYNDAHLPLIFNFHIYSNLENAMTFLIDNNAIHELMDENQISEKNRGQLKKVLDNNQKNNPILEVVYLR